MSYIYKYVINALFLFSSFYSRSQAFSLSVNSASQCFSAGNNSAQATVASTVAGATAYTWIATASGTCQGLVSTSGNGQNASITFPCCGIYNIYCSAVNGTINPGAPVIITSTVISHTVTCPPSISVSGPNGFCAGASVTLTAAGAQSYTWLPGNMSGSVAVISPSASTCYTVIGNSSSGCSGSSTKCITKYANPVISVSSGSFCTGQPRTLTATGAMSFSWQPFGLSGASIVVTPTSSVCYTVTGITSAGCVGTATNCLTMIAPPVISISGPTLNCAGNGVTLVAGGGGSYTWQPSNTIASSINVNPAAYSCYSVTGYILGCTNTAVHCVSVVSAPPLTVTGNSVVCPGTATSFSVSGAANYLWTIGTQTVSGSVFSITPTANSCFTVRGTASAGCFVFATACVSVIPATFTVSGPNGVCAGGGNATLTATGAQNYTWMPGNLTGSIVVLSPTVNTCYSIVSSNTTGCSVPVYKCLNIFANPVISVSGGSFCAGQPRTLTAGGAMTYTWQPFNLTGNAITVSPSGSTCYTVTGTTSAGCVGSGTNCLSMSSPPTVTIGGATSACAGSSVALTAGGALSYTWKPLNATNTVITVNPGANSCYTLIGYAYGCTNTAVKCITVQTTSITVTPASYTVCKGSSATFTANGANTYTWFTGANGSTVNVLPLNNMFFNVYGYGSNGCVGYKTVSLTVNQNCSDVWPGDANSNGIVTNLDIFEIGLAFNNTGSPRPSGSNIYVSQFANNWVGTISTGKNKCHADCNGDGTVNLADTLAVYNNFFLSHSFKPLVQVTENTDISISPSVGVYTEGAWNKVDILLNDAGNAIASIAGVAFDFNFDQSLIVADSAFLEYSPSFLSAGNQNVQFRKNYFSNGVIYAASVRTNGTDVNGMGKIGEFHFKMKSGLPANTVLNLAILNSSRINQSGLNTAISSGSAQLYLSAVGVKSVPGISYQVIVAPNPASNQLTLLCDAPANVHFQMFDLSGIEVLNGNFSRTKTIDLAAIASGSYILKFDTGTAVYFKKLIVNR